MSRLETDRFPSSRCSNLFPFFLKKNIGFECSECLRFTIQEIESKARISQMAEDFNNDDGDANHNFASLLNAVKFSRFGKQSKAQWRDIFVITYSCLHRYFFQQVFLLIVVSCSLRSAWYILCLIILCTPSQGRHHLCLWCFAQTFEDSSFRVCPLCTEKYL